jgi:hypothetical protein
LAAFFLATFRAPAEINWPIAAYASVIPLAAAVMTGAADRAARWWWRGAIAYGTAALVAIHLPLAAAGVPFVGRYVPTNRFQGFAARAQQIGGPIREFVAASDRPTLIVAPSHNMAGLLAFYLPGRPAVASAGRYLGDRPSAYDFFDDTDLSGPAVSGRPAVLLGGNADLWRTAFDVGELTLLSMDGPQFVARSFGGPRLARTGLPATVAK